MIYLRDWWYSFRSGYVMCSGRHSSTVKIGNSFFVASGVPQFEIGNDLIALRGYLQFTKVNLGDTVFDIGASAGITSMAFAKMVGPNGKVIALEPDKTSFEKLKSNLRCNSVTNVLALPMGVWNKKDRVFFDSKGQSSQTGFGDDFINVTTIDNLTETYGKPNLVKMDIEGAELEALEGAKLTRGNGYTDWAIASYHIRDGESTSSRCREFLNGWKYTGYPSHETTYGTHQLHSEGVWMPILLSFGIFAMVLLAVSLIFTVVQHP